MTGNVVLFEVDALLYVGNKPGRKTRALWGTGITECMTL
jgi:hypothetical protein